MAIHSVRTTLVLFGLVLVLSSTHVVSFTSFLDSALFQVTKASSSLSPKPPSPNKIALPLLQAASKSQSVTNRIRVEELVEELTKAASQRPFLLRKPIESGSYRTVWSTVTSDNFFGFLMNNPPSNVLGGPSWQVVSEDMREGTNIVYWKDLDIRMAGLARLSPLPGGVAGYSLQISGLEFRWGAGGCPEKENRKTSKAVDTKVWRVFELPEEETLGNGVGTLELLYNDGAVRITKDNVQQNTYIHVKEPIGLDLERMFSTQGI